MIKKIKNRDIEKVYTKGEFIKKIRRLADSLEKDQKFSIQVAGCKIKVPKDAVINIEHEKEKRAEELEFQVRWKY